MSRMEWTPLKSDGFALAANGGLNRLAFREVEIPDGVSTRSAVQTSTSIREFGNEEWIRVSPIVLVCTVNGHFSPQCSILVWPHLDRFSSFPPNGFRSASTFNQGVESDNKESNDQLGKLLLIHLFNYLLLYVSFREESLQS